MVISACATEEDKHRVLDVGVNEFISKPFDSVELKKRIQNVLRDKSRTKNKGWAELLNNKDTLTGMEQNILKKLNKVILNHISHPDLTIDLLADELNASRSKTIRMIKKLTGKTPLAYIRMIRMDFSHEMIKVGKVKNATEAARAIGLGTVTHFSKAYKDHFGFLPFKEKISKQQ